MTRFLYFNYQSNKKELTAFDVLTLGGKVVSCRGSSREYFEARYEGVSKSFRTGRLERELQMVQLSATRCSCIAIL
jgi:hypothetical protein